MSNVLRFWRDVEIFNIPDAPSFRNHGTPRAPPVAETAADPADDADDEADPAHESRPRGKVLQRFHIDSADVLLPWHDPRFRVADPGAEEGADDDRREPASYAHAVYLGVGPKQRFMECVLRVHGVTATDDELYRPAPGDGWMAAFLVGADGTALDKTYAAASFVVGSGLLRENLSLDDVGDALRARSQAFDARMDEHRQDLAHDTPDAAPYPLAWDDLLAEWRLAHAPLAVDGEPPPGTVIAILSVPLYRRKDGSLNPPPEQAATFLNSFFIDDLTALLQGGQPAASAALAQYLGPDSPAAERTDLLAGAGALADHARPALIPAGRWPAPPHEHLALAQQAAVYQTLYGLADSAGGLMAINGPPGTGKTTLLKDLIAEVVVRRAMRLARLDDPGELFTDRVVSTGLDDKGVQLIRPEIVEGTEIVVTSSNNAAVQNISFELPFSCDKAAFADAAYFPATAALVAEKFGLTRAHPWGLLAATLGAKRNRDKIGTALMGYERAFEVADPATYPQPGVPASLKPALDAARRGQPAPGGIGWRQYWHDARRDFHERVARVDALRAVLVELEEAVRELPAMAAQRDAVATALEAQEQARQELAAAAAAQAARCATQRARDDVALHALVQQAAAQETQRAAAADRLAEARELEYPGWLACALKRVLGLETRGYRHWKQVVGEARAALDRAAGAVGETVRARLALTALIAARHKEAEEASRAAGQAAAAVADRIAELAATARELAAREARMRQRIAAAQAGAEVPRLADAAFLALPAAERQRASLWVTPALERERSGLFLAALRLHEAAMMANAGTWFGVLRGLREFLAGRAQPSTREGLAGMWHALFFAVPVVATTLASFGSLFRGLERASLGWVLIDEAGQAPPAAVAGALWRARRAVVVGDPLQIEPIVTVPRKLVERLAASRGLDAAALARWSPSLHSAQTLADRTMRLGARIGDTWTGMPLRTHRRCMAPMVGIANRIAYDGQMVQATVARQLEPGLPPSGWIDVRGPASGKVVAAQIEALCGILASFLEEWPCVVRADGTRAPASVYVIAPFRDVAQACKERLDGETALGRRLANRKRVVDAGTVHTFQGKEASIVFLVLGSAEGEAGAASRSWAASKPNLLNVAVTRAQQRFYAIGNYADWTGLPFFCELAEPAGWMRRVPAASLAPAQRALAP